MLYRFDVDMSYLYSDKKLRFRLSINNIMTDQ